MKLRRTLMGAALAVAATMGITAPPAAASDACTNAASVYGWNAAAQYDLSGNYNMDWKTTTRLGSSVTCSSSNYKYEQIVFIGSTVYARSSVQGTTSSGAVSFATVRTGVIPGSTSKVALGIRVYKRAHVFLPWEVVSEGAGYVNVPNKTYDSATGQNTSSAPCATSQPTAGTIEITRGYGSPCLPLPI
jgi:hypothetical protein